MNKKDFTQLYISPALSHFKKGFQEKWNLVDYYDINLPAIFFGMYGQQDVDYFLNHRGYKIIVWGGNDMHPPQLEIAKQEILKRKTFTYSPPGEFSDTLTNFHIPHKITYIPNKDYSSFTPTPLGENIYVYLGQPDNIRLEYFEFENIVQPLMYVFGENRVKWVKEDKTLTINELKEKYYNDCFVFVKPNKRGGATSMYELAHMGRRTIGKGQIDMSNFTEFKDLDDLINLIVEESKYIGQIREDIHNDIKNIFIGDEWLNLNYWK